MRLLDFNRSSYQEKAEEDALAVFKRVEGILESLGSLRGKLVIPMETIRSFCKNAANLQAIKYRFYFVVDSFDSVTEHLAQKIYLTVVFNNT